MQSMISTRNPNAIIDIEGSTVEGKHRVRFTLWGPHRGSALEMLDIIEVEPHEHSVAWVYRIMESRAAKAA